MTNYLPDNASLESLKKQAKSLLKRVHDGDEEIVAQIRGAHPRYQDVDPSSLKLADVQLLISQYYGFNNWAELKRSLQPNDTDGEALANRFLRLGILRYGGSFEMNIRKAEQLWQTHPELAETNIWTAATLGNAEAVERFLDEQPDLVRTKGGPYNDTPLLCVCYSRAHFEAPSLDAPSNPSFDAMATARLLLERGADADDHYYTHGTYRFTCITGAIGEGENGPKMCPPHPQSRELVTLLLEHGANPNDGQGLYDSMFTGGTHWLELLFSYGLKQGDPINWAENDGVTTLDYLLAHAAKNNMIDRVELLLQHGADPNCIDWYDKKPVYELAFEAGNKRVLELLVEHGGKPIKPKSLQEAFYSACMAADREAINQARSASGESKLAEWIKGGKGHVARAASANKMEAVRLMLKLGFPLGQALFDAAWHGRLEIARLLVENGARVTERHHVHSATAIGFAERAGHQEVVEFLMSQEIDVFDAVRFGDVARVEGVLSAVPEALEHRYRDYTTAKTDWAEHTPILHAAVLGRDDIACWLLANGSDSNVRLGKRSLLEIAQENECHKLVHELHQT